MAGSQQEMCKTPLFIFVVFWLGDMLQDILEQFFNSLYRKTIYYTKQPKDRWLD